MSTSRTRLSFLFQRYYDGDATQSESDELMELVRMAQNDEQLSGLINDAWNQLRGSDEVFSREAGNRILDSIISGDRYKDSAKLHLADIASDEPEHQPFWRRYWVAAAIALVCLPGVWWMLDGAGSQREDAAVAVPADIKPGSNRAVLTLADGSAVELDDAQNGLISQQGESAVSKVGDGQLAYNPTGGASGSSELNTVSTPRGGQYQVILPDGSRVWLNAASSIRFPTGFAENERRVEIEGEVFFEIVKEAKRPFRVGFGSNEVEVLGTSFNISDYPEEQDSRTTLVEGSVLLNSKGQKNKLQPGQLATVSKEGAVSIEVVDVEEVIAWKNGYFYFQGAGITAVMQQVSRWYDVEVGYEGALAQKQFTGKVSRSVGLTEFMEMLRYVGVKYRMEGRKIVIGS